MNLRSSSLALLVAVTALLAGCTTPEKDAEEPHSRSPYVELLASSIRGLSEQEIADLAAGAGMGYARPAELNGYPGPLHVLELREELELSDDQYEQVVVIRADMLAQARPLGEEYLELYKGFEERFRAGEMDEATVQEYSDKLGTIDGALRAVHLSAHLTTRDVLTQHQRFEYDRLRGYSDGEMDHAAHGMDH